jgi:hypothetical protein
MGYSSTLEYVAAAAAAVLAETGLMPHVNAGVMGQSDIERWVASVDALLMFVKAKLDSCRSDRDVVVSQQCFASEIALSGALQQQQQRQ